MAAKPKLTPEEWNNARSVWESDQRKGFPWLIEELALPVSSEALRLRSKSEGWRKAGEPSLDIKTKLVEGKKTKLVQKIKEIPTKKEKPTQEVAKNNPPYRPTLYKQEYDKQAFEFCLMGATDATLAVHFEVDEATINRWKIAHPSFCESLKDGKGVADANVASSLYKSAMGMHISTEDKVISNGEGGQEVVTLEKQIDPSITAQIFWLKNRQSKNWKDKVEQEVTLDMRLIPWDDLRLISEKAVELAEEKHKSLIDGRAERLALKIEYTSDSINTDGK